MPVVRVHGVDVDRVRFSAARLTNEGEEVLRLPNRMYQKPKAPLLLLQSLQLFLLVGLRTITLRKQHIVRPRQNYQIIIRVPDKIICSKALKIKEELILILTNIRKLNS